MIEETGQNMDYQTKIRKTDAIRRVVFGLLILAVITGSAQGAIYYVDSSGGSDLNTGLSSGSPWKTIDRVNDSMSRFLPGDSILFKRGSTFSDAYLNITVGGEEGHPLVFGAYGSGNRPLFRHATYAVVCTRNNLRDIVIQDLHCMDQTGGGAIIFVGVSRNITIARCYVENQSNNGIFIKMCDTYLIEDCEVHTCGNACITIYGSPEDKITNGIVRNNICSGALTNDGINIHKDDYGNHAGANHLFENNVCYDCAENGIDVTAGSYITLRGNETFLSGEAGLLLGDTPHTICDRHYSHDERIGIHVGGATHLTLTNSIIYNAFYHTLTIAPSTSASDIHLYNNTLAYGPDSTGLLMDINEKVSNITARNNIFTTAQYDRPKTYIRFAGGATPASAEADFDYNIFWRRDGISNDRFNDQTQGNFSFSEWRSIYGQGQHSYFTDPLLKNLASEDFHPLVASPAVDSGTDVGLDCDFDGCVVPQGSAPDIGALEYASGTPPVPVTATASATPSSGYAPLAVAFSGNASGGSSSYSYTWSFGDGGTSTSRNPSHTFSQAGNYTVTLTVRDDQGSSDSDSLIISASRQIAALNASAAASPVSGTAPLAVSFSGSASGGISPYSYAWVFGDGGSSGSQNPTHTYNQAGTRTATLTVTDTAGSTAAASVQIIITAPVSPLLASAAGTPTSGLAPLPVSFTGGASGGTTPYSYHWAFGDGAVSSDRNPDHTYSQAGTYSAILTVTDNSGLQNADSVSVTVSSGSSQSELSISTATGAPAPGWGGTTNPGPGSLELATGSQIRLEAAPNLNYRFARWTGDVALPDAYGRAIDLTMDRDRNVTAHFYTRCGDVNGDLTVSPTDSQMVFEIFLGMIPNLTTAQKENADVNVDGTPDAPMVTPSDAQAIFEKFLGISELPGDCSCEQRARTSETSLLGDIDTAGNDLPAGPGVMIQNPNWQPGREVTIPVVLEDPFQLTAFGFDLAFPAGSLEFVRMNVTDLSSRFVQFDTNCPSEGVLRVGGYSEKTVTGEGGSVLFEMVFKVHENPKEGLSITKQYDDFKTSPFKFIKSKSVKGSR